MEQFGDSVAISKSTALITPYQSFKGIRTSDNTVFLATYDTTVARFDEQDILVGNTDLKSKECRGIGNSIIPIRFNNRPEIILIELYIKDR